MKNVISASQKTAASGQCVPYEKGMFSASPATASASQAAAMPSPVSAPVMASRSTAPASLPALYSLAPNPDYQFPEQSLFVDPARPTPAPMIPATSQSIARTETSIQPQESSSLPSQMLIYMCPGEKGEEIIEAKTPPSVKCSVIGKKAKTEGKTHLGKAAPNQTEMGPPPESAGEGAIATTESAPVDIYKCYDDSGKPSYVAANKRDRFRHCSFFSRSFASASQEFIKRSQQAPSLTELAVQGVNDSNDELNNSTGLRCIGAGEVRYNGGVRKYNCATRSFDHSPGSSGGEVVQGSRSATIAAHRLDYLGASGSCGGTITNADGKILHLEPTKNCPEEFVIEAREIKKTYLKTISIPVNGAFLERQRTLAPQINRIANNIGVDPFLVHAVISAESAYKSRAVSHAGARGLMQLMPATARRFGVSDSFHTGENIRGGATYLKWLLKKFNGNMELAIAGYNAGEGNVMKYGYTIPPFIETRAYVPKVMEYYRRYRNNPSLVGLQ